MNETRRARLAGSLLVLLGAVAVAAAVLFPAVFGNGDNGLLLAGPASVMGGLALLYINRPTVKGRARRAARRSA